MRFFPLALLALMARPVDAVGLVALAGASAVAVGAIVWKAARSRNLEIYQPELNRLVGKTIVITGATTGLGLESAKRLAMGGANLILTARSDAKGQAAVDAVADYLRERGLSYDGQKVTYKLLDLDNLSSVKKAADWNIPAPIDALINNAGIMALPKRELTVDGFEKQMQSNHLGHFALTAILSSKFSKDCRIINISSEAHKLARWTKGGLDFDYIWKAEKGYLYWGWKSYGQSKLANILFTQELQRRIDKAGLLWKTAAVHPGIVATDLGRTWLKIDALVKLMHSLSKLNIINRTVEHGASTQVWLAAGAAEDEGEDIRGKYYSDYKAERLGDFATNATSAKRLWEESEEHSGVSFTL